MKKINFYIIGFLAIFNVTQSTETPFFFQYDKKTNLIEEDYLKIQESYDLTNIENFLIEFYEEARRKDRLFTLPYSVFYNRVTRSLRNVMIDKSKNLLPSQQLIKINDGSDICFVSSVPFRENYPEMMDKQIIALKNCGFNGFYLAFRGLFPTPTGEEVNLSTVPYAFKFFCINEALKLGFKQVIWIDSAYIPVRNPISLFKDLPKIGAIFTALPPNGFGRYLCPSITAEKIFNLTGVDVHKSTYVVAAIMGFYADDPLVKEFINEFYEMAKLGYPFLSGTPEENVLTGIIGKKKYRRWLKYNSKKNSPLWLDNRIRTYSEREAKKVNGFFYYHSHPIAT
jgi:hypothetical protein